MRIQPHYPLMGALVAMSMFCAPDATAAGGDQRHSNQPAATGLVRIVRNATHRFLDVARAERNGYGPILGCTSGHTHGAMGLHYANAVLVGDGTLDASRPDLLVYEPLRNGRMRLVAVEYLVIAEAWNAVNPGPPVLEGQLFHYEGSPNRYGLPPFYSLHVWAWKENPEGVFASWNPRVSCAAYDPA